MSMNVVAASLAVILVLVVAFIFSALIGGTICLIDRGHKILGALCGLGIFVMMVIGVLIQ